MVSTSNLGFPRIGAKRELKKALESFWAGKIDENELESTARSIRRSNWLVQKEASIDFIPSNDFSFYDHVLDMSCVVGAVPARYNAPDGEIDRKTYFAMARGAGGNNGVSAMEMTKWFDTNYHYIVPEFDRNTRFSLRSSKPVDELNEAIELGVHTRPVIIGPVTFLLLGKGDGVEPLELLDDLLPVYAQLLDQLGKAGADWVQIDEPFLALDIEDDAKEAYKRAYAYLDEKCKSVKLLAATYFGELRDNTDLACSLPVAGLHIDLRAGEGQHERVVSGLSKEKLLSVGVIDGRNIWKNDFSKTLELVRSIAERAGEDRLIIGPSCSMLHTPVDLDLETGLDREIVNWLAYSKQKVHELSVLARALNDGEKSVTQELAENQKAMESRRTSRLIHNPEVARKVGEIDNEMKNRKSPFEQRRKLQQAGLNLPKFPTTTIGSYPQTREIRKNRSAYRRGRLDESEYNDFIKKQIEDVVRFQEKVGLDVLVHGEPERNDMVEYFGEQLEGYISTKYGWVQSYGSRCVKPPIIFGDVQRPSPMTVDWTTYAQSLTDKPMKGMLTGPVTMLKWAFVRDDQPIRDTCRQIALALREEVRDLEAAGIRVIQMDEPALREGLPLRREDWSEYLDWAVECFRLAASVVTDQTQIHTHMCYAEFNDIIEAIAALDADVISIESSRSNMELLDAFRKYKYPNDIGPGVYDIHSPRVPDTEEMTRLLGKALNVLSPDQIWVNPDCGLKTRNWKEVEPSIENMVEAARRVRSGEPVPATS